MKHLHLLFLMSILLMGCAGQLATEETAVQPSASTTSPTAPASIESESLARPSRAAVPPTTAAPQPQLTAPPIPTPQPPIPTVPPAATNVRRGENESYDFRQWAGFDGIPPIYEPQFVTADNAPLRDDELVMGVSLGGDAKAYPITVLQFREMVNDELAGIPILVSW